MKTYWQAFAAALCLMALPLPIEASDSQEKLQQINRLTRQIFLKDIEVERFNIQYRLKSNVQGRWRGPRYFLSQEANNAATMAGLFDAVHLRYPAVKDEARRPPRAALERSFIPQMVGQIIGGTGSAIELSINKYHDWQAAKAGLSHKAAMKRAERFDEELHDLFSQRTRLIADAAPELSEYERKLLDAQSRVLHDLCDISLDEFSRFYVQSRRFRAFQDSLYVLDIAKNAVGAVGNGIAMYSIDHRRAKLNGPAGLCTFISGALISANPVISRTVGWSVGKLAAKRTASFRKQFSEDIRQLNADSTELQELIAAHLLDRKADLADREVQAGTRAATENVLAGGIIGMTKMSLGICAMIAGYRTYADPVTSNKLLYGGSTAYGVGSAIGVADNVRIQVRNEIERRKLSRRHLLAGQILGDQLKELDRLESKLRSDII